MLCASIDAVFGKGGRVVLVELGLVEQRLAAVKEVLDDGATVTDVARRSGSHGRRCTRGLITPETRKRKRSDYRRWERSRAMELWQMDIVGGVRLADGSEAKIVSGIDDHSRFVVSAQVVARGTARPTCDALLAAIGRHGAAEQIPTDTHSATRR